MVYKVRYWHLVYIHVNNILLTRQWACILSSLFPVFLPPISSRKIIYLHIWSCIWLITTLWHSHCHLEKQVIASTWVHSSKQGTCMPQSKSHKHTDKAWEKKNPGYYIHEWHFLTCISLENRWSHWKELHPTAVHKML